MREKIINIINDISGLGEKVENISDLISGGHLDSFGILMLINTLEVEYNINFDFNDELFENLNSVNKIEKMLKSKKSAC